MEMKERLFDVLNRLKDQVDYLEIRLEDSRETKIDVKNGKVDSINTNFICGGNVRTLYKGGWGFTVFKDVDGLEEAATKSVTQAKLVGRDTTHWASVEPVEYIYRIQFINNPRQVPLEEKVTLFKEYTNLIKGYDPKIVTSQARYQEKFMHTVFANSEGSYIDQEYTDNHLALVAAAAENGQSQSANLTMGTCDDFNVFRGQHEAIKETCQLAIDLLSAPRIKGGKYTVILNPELTGVFTHEAFGHTMEADFIADNPGMCEVLKNGKVFGEKFLNIYDSGVIPGLRGSYAYDAEGTPTEKTYLLKEGVVVGHLHSRETAAKMNEKPTGNARAISYLYPPIVRMRNTAIEGGTATFEEMIKDVELGVYAIDAKGGKGGENFSFTAHHGIMIRNGQLAELVKGFTLAGNLFKTLQNIDLVGNDEEVVNRTGGCGKGEQFPMPVTDGGPHIRIRNVTIGGDE